MNTTAFVLFISIFFAVGFGLLGYSGYSWIRARQAQSWPGAAGDVRHCEMVTNGGSDGNTYVVKVRYAYRVDGRYYEGTRVAFGYAGSSTLHEHQAIESKLSKSRSVIVRYNPTDPSQSVLAAGINRSIQLMMVFAITWLLFVTGFTTLIVMSQRGSSSLADQISAVEHPPQDLAKRAATNPG
jgi:hypothetical protein